MRFFLTMYLRRMVRVLRDRMVTGARSFPVSGALRLIRLDAEFVPLLSGIMRSEYAMGSRLRGAVLVAN